MIVNVIIKYLLFVLLIQLTACKKVIYIVGDVYDKNNEIYVCDYLLSEAYEYVSYKFLYRKPDKYFDDSVFAILRNQLRNLPVNLFFEAGGINLVDSSFLQSKYNSFRLPPEELILNMSKKCNRKNVLVPFIFFRHKLAPVSGGTWYSTQLCLTLYVVEANEITFAYSKELQAKKRVFTTTKNTGRRMDLHTEQEWQDIINSVIQPYIDRMKD